MFDYIEENLEKIKNPDDVNIIKTRKVDKGFYLIAQLNKGAVIPITQHDKNPTSEPFYLLASKVGRKYFNNFAAISEHVAVNRNHLTKLGYVDESLIDKRLERVQLYAYFDDGRQIYLANPLRQYFFEETKSEIEAKCGIKFENITNMEDIFDELKQQNELNQ